MNKPVSESESNVEDVARKLASITRENKALFQRMVESERTFRKLARAVWMVQEDERRRLARELHDGIGQTLTALKNQLERIQKRNPGGNSLAGALAESVELVSSALNDTRELSRLLRPAVLDDLGLEAALSWLTRTVSQQTGLSINLSCDIGEERLETEHETLIFRIVQESLTNIIKHADSSCANVTLERPGAFLAVAISDEGKGFDVDAERQSNRERNGSGLRGMRDRVRLFGGRLSIRSAPGAGTTVEFSLPLEAVESDA